MQNKPHVLTSSKENRIQSKNFLLATRNHNSLSLLKQHAISILPIELDI